MARAIDFEREAARRRAQVQKLVRERVPEAPHATTFGELLEEMVRLRGEIRALYELIAPPSPPLAVKLAPEADFINEREAEQLLNLRNRSLEYRRHKGIGPPHIKIGSVVRYQRSVVLAWARELEVKSTKGKGKQG